VQASKIEASMGSTLFLWATLGMGLMINIIYAAVTALIFSLMSTSTAVTVFGLPISSGLWPVIMFLITSTCLADRAGTTPFCTIRISNVMFPFLILALFCLLSAALALELIIAVALGVMNSYGLLRYVTPTHAQIARWEAQGGVLYRIGLVRAAGYLLAPATGVQGGETSSNVFSNVSMFSRSRTTTAAPPGGSANQASGSDAPATGFSVFRAGGATAPSRPPATEDATTSSSFTGAGQRLGAPSAGTSAPTVSEGTEASKAAAARAAALARLQSISGKSSQSPASASRLGFQVQSQSQSQSQQVEDDNEYDVEGETDDNTRLLPAPPKYNTSHASSRPIAPGPPALSASAVATLVSRGYAENDVKRALADADGDVEIAEVLLASR
jgi:hypothetical protein